MAPSPTKSKPQRTTSRSPRDKQRDDQPVNFWREKAATIDIGRFEFRFFTERDGRRKQLIIDDMVIDVDWTDSAGSEGLMQGSLTVQRPDFHKFKLLVGDAVVCEYSPWGRGAWKPLWKMFLTQPEYQLSGDQFVYQLEDGLDRLKQSKATYHFRKDKGHPHGWRVDEAIRKICLDNDIEVGELPRMKHRIMKFNLLKVSPLTAIARLLRKERTATGIRYFSRWTGGTLNIVPFQRGKFLLRIGGDILDGTLIETQKANFATVLDLISTHDKKTTDGDGHKKHDKSKIKTTVRASDKVIARYGVVRKTVAHNDATSTADLRKWGKRELADRAKVKRDFTFTHPGIPNIRTGDAMMVTVPKAGMDRVVCFVGDVSHTVSPGDYTMDVTVQFDDPFVERKADKVRKKKADAAKKRGRRGDDDDDKADDHKPKYKKNGQRS